MAGTGESLITNRWPRSGSGSPGGRASRVLIVDDDAGYSQLVAEMLLAASGDKLELHHAATLGDALVVIESVDPGCVLLDLTLPDARRLGGLKVLRDQAPRLSIVILTADYDDDLALEALTGGAQDYLTKDEVDGRSLLRAVRYAIERHRADERLRRARLRDPLTGLPARALLADAVRLALERRKRTDCVVGLLVFDIDEFARVRSALTPARADALLAAVVRRVRGTMRSADTVGRISGEQFMVVCEDLAGPAVALTVGRRMSETIARPYMSQDGPVRLTASVGVATAGTAEVDADQLMGEAVAASAAAKSHAGISVDAFGEHTRSDAIERVSMTAELHDAITRDTLVVHYQPQVELATGRLHGLEALVRWPGGDAGLRMPDSFIPAAERSGLIVSLGNLVLHHACHDLARWRARGLAGGVRMSVNVSGGQLRDSDMPAHLSAALEGSGLDPADLTLELTESSVMLGSGTEEALEVIRALGPRLALDDFGTGFAALAALVELPFDEIKIDQMFIAAMDHGQRPRRIVGPVLHLAGDLGMNAVCEGIETREQLAVLLEADATIGQGYFFSRPAPPEIAALWLAPGYTFDVSVN